MDIQQTILITGAASGLGQATVKFLSSHGAKLIQLDKSAINKEIIHCDVADENQVKNILDNLKDIPRVCINCAGIVYAKKVSNMTANDFKKVLDINLVGTFNIIKYCTDKMKLLEPINKDGERGVIINVSSIAAFEGQIGQVAYSASKGAIASMTLPLAREFAQLGIRVMTIAPGMMETPMLSQICEDVRDKLISQIPFPKKLGDPKEFAMLVKHIIENSYLNGSVIRLDGGLRMI
jgi:NAD(P)-dependent dehydrogenase (short-subunit alcohol dehydrogenase family)